MPPLRTSFPGERHSSWDVLAMVRSLFVFLHRWVSLTLAGFLVIAALTGSLLAFNTELERVFAPQLFAKPRAGTAPLDLATLAEKGQMRLPDRRVQYVLYAEPDQVLVTFAGPKDPRGELQLFLDPWTGAELGRRYRGNISEGWVNLMPFIYKLHWTLLLSDIGSMIFGVVAIAWSIDCFVGLYLTLPASLRRFWSKWKLAWVVKPGAGPFRLNFDLHRATGLWMWPMLLVFAWSSVMFNMRPVYEWVTKTVIEYQSPRAQFAQIRKQANDHPLLDWKGARAAGERLAAELSAQKKFRVSEALGLGYISALGAYSYELRSSRDVFERSPKGGSTHIFLDANTGQLLAVRMPTGEHAGNTVESWLYALHMARTLGRPYQLFVCCLGLLIVLLSITGIVIWAKKRAARTRRRAVELMELEGMPLAKPKSETFSLVPSKRGQASPIS